MTPDKQFLKTEIIFPGSVPGNNGKNGLLRMHWRKRGKLLNQYLLTVLATSRNRHAGPVCFELIRHSINPTCDFDNLVSTGKLLTDAIVRAGIISDDNPGVIVKRTYTQTKAMNQASQMTVVRITDLDDVLLP